MGWGVVCKFCVVVDNLCCIFVVEFIVVVCGVELCVLLELVVGIGVGFGVVRVVVLGVGLDWWLVFEFEVVDVLLCLDDLFDVVDDVVGVLV